MVFFGGSVDFCDPIIFRFLKDYRNFFPGNIGISSVRLFHFFFSYDDHFATLFLLLGDRRRNFLNLDHVVGFLNRKGFLKLFLPP